MTPCKLLLLGRPAFHADVEINSNSTQKNPDDIVITLAIRTPLTKAGKGGLKDTPLDGIVFKLLEQVVQVSCLRRLF